MKNQSFESSAPARVNLLGEHTDYNFGYVMPTPLRYQTRVRIDVVDGEQVSVQSSVFKEGYVFKVGANKRGLWTDYIAGSIAVLLERGLQIPGLSVFVESDVPMGMGMSSSAALTVATLRALRGVVGVDISDLEIASLAHAVETKHVGVPCGIMDQMVCAVGRPGYALFLDTQTMATDYIKLPEEYRFCILHSGIQHELKAGDGGYRQRVFECKQACEMLGVTSLRSLHSDSKTASRIGELPDPVNRRAAHVFSENERVLEGVAALRAGDMKTYGRLMLESHYSQRDDYEVSVPKIDQIVDSAMRCGALGARLTGGGFGGSVIALVENDRVSSWWSELSSDVKGVTLL